MNTFELNEESLRKSWEGEHQYWFSLKNYEIVPVSALADLEKPEGVSQSAYFVSLGYIPYFTVGDREVQHAFVSTISNQKIKNKMAATDSRSYADAFWKYHHVYPEDFAGFEAFADKYALEKGEQWCRENNIQYIVK